MTVVVEFKILDNGELDATWRMSTDADFVGLDVLQQWGLANSGYYPIYRSHSGQTHLINIDVYMNNKKVNRGSAYFKHVERIIVEIRDKKIDDIIL